jgi:2,4-dienoyl-CoA reductase-like NADH-dependent reductase (Old Yellow Enzyme family)
MPEATIAPLLEPITIRGVTLRNRVMMSPMSRAASSNGVPGANVTSYYRQRAEGGVGTIFTEAISIEHPGALGDIGLGDGAAPYLWTDAALAAWRGIVAGVHGAGAVIFPQLMHFGVMKYPGSGGAHREDRIAGPSGLWGPADRPSGLAPDMILKLNQPGRAYSDADVEQLIAAYAASAANAKAVGFDGVAIHGGHGYLIDNFLWEGTNARTDRWGGDHVERTRFAVEVVRAVRAAIGEEMPISFRFSQWKPQDFTAQLARSPEALEEILAPIGEAGVDIFEASTRDFTDLPFEGSDMSLAGWTKKLTGKLTAMVGGTTVKRGKLEGTFTPPQTIDNLAEIMVRHARGEFDLLQVGRALLNDPRWLEKAQKGEELLPFDPRCLVA